jgi:hypothetical protein
LNYDDFGSFIDPEADAHNFFLKLLGSEPTMEFDDLDIIREEDIADAMGIPVFPTDAAYPVEEPESISAATSYLLCAESGKKRSAETFASVRHPVDPQPEAAVGPCAQACTSSLVLLEPDHPWMAVVRALVDTVRKTAAAGHVKVMVTPKPRDCQDAWTFPRFWSVKFSARDKSLPSSPAFRDTSHWASLCSGVRYFTPVSKIMTALREQCKIPHAAFPNRNKSVKPALCERSERVDTALIVGSCAALSTIAAAPACHMSVMSAAVYTERLRVRCGNFMRKLIGSRGGAALGVLGGIVGIGAAAMFNRR